MKLNLRHSVLLVLCVLWGCARTSPACTIFVLTDANNALFFNNEDYSNPNTRLWFIPSGKDYHGCAYVGFDDGWAQGGVNEKGLAFDWVAGFTSNYKCPPHLKRVRGNPSERMLETCATVDEAIAFYRTHREPSFATGRIMIADRSGASVIIGANGPELEFKISTQSRGFGYGREKLEEMLANSAHPSVTNGMNILRACAQEGSNATKYSSAINLKAGEIIIRNRPDETSFKVLNLAAELQKGAHYYAIPAMGADQTNEPQELPSNMRRFALDEYKPLTNADAKVTKRIRKFITDSALGKLREEDYSPEMWKAINPKEMETEMKALGKFIRLTPLERTGLTQARSHRYRLEFQKAIIQQVFEFNPDNRLTSSKSEAVEILRD